MGLIAFIFAGFIILACTIIVLVAFAFRKRAAYFKSHHIPYIGFSLSRQIQSLTGSVDRIEIEKQLYLEAKSKNVPIVAFSDLTGQSTLMVLDLDIMRQIMVKDFDHFLNQRPMNLPKSSKFFTKMLFVMRDEHWKAMRGKMTPAFTTGKIRRMYEIFQRSGESMNTYLHKNLGIQNSMDMDLSQVLFKYSMDVIASCAFGVDSQSWTKPVDQLTTFEKFGKMMEFKLGAKQLFKFLIIAVMPKVADMLELDIFDQEPQNYFAGVIRQVVKHRRQTGERQEDFVQLMMDIQQGSLKDTEQEKSDALKTSIKMDFDESSMIANSLAFFLGGFDTSQSALLFAAYNLALHSDKQEKLYQQIKEMKAKHGGKLTYEALLELPYLEMVVQESLRVFPPLIRAERECSQDYVVKETGLKIEKGTILMFPSYGIHMDEKYYKEPEKFLPERFSNEEKGNRHPYTFMTFGQGPRHCIGMRFALVKVRAAIAHLVSEFKLEPCEKTAIPMKFANSLSLKPLDGMWLKITARNDI